MEQTCTYGRIDFLLTSAGTGIVRRGLLAFGDSGPSGLQDFEYSLEERTLIPRSRTQSQWLGIPPSKTIIACICLFEIIPVYGLLGYIPAIRRFGVFGLQVCKPRMSYSLLCCLVGFFCHEMMKRVFPCAVLTSSKSLLNLSSCNVHADSQDFHQQPWEMYPLGAIYGFVLGGLSSYCRSLFGELIPPGSEAAFYALYAITDKGSSVFGPAIVGAITDRYGEIRPAFVFLAVLIFIPLPLMLLVDVDRGKRDGAEMARELEGKDDVLASGSDEITRLVDNEED